MKQSLQPWFRLSIFLGSTIGVVLVVVILHWHFGYPIAHSRALPFGTPWWWSVLLAGAAGIFAVLLGFTVESARDAVRRSSSADLRVAWREDTSKKRRRH